jgi:hypothetical protein
MPYDRVPGLLYQIALAAPHCRTGDERRRPAGTLPEPRFFLDISLIYRRDSETSSGC